MTGEANRSPKEARALWRRLLGWLFAAAFLLGLAVVTLDSPIGHRFVADRIAAYAPESGLRIGIGRITGSLFGEARLRDVTLSDPQGVFARIPEAELDWRPLRWFVSGLDLRRLVLRRGRLERLPRLRPGDPDAPILPAFDIRIDRLEIDNLRVAEGVIGPERRVDLQARADIRKGRALVRIDGKLGGRDRLFALLDAEPDRDRFDLKLDYAAPKGGLLAGLSGTDSAFELAIGGKGGWRQWDGTLLARQDGRKLAAFRLGNRAGRYSLLGQAWPGDLTTGLARRAAGDVVSLDAQGTLAASVFDGRIVAVSRALQASGKGKVDLARNLFSSFVTEIRLIDPALFGDDARLDDARLSASLDGPFRDLAVQYRAGARRATFGTVLLEQVTGEGLARFDGARWKIPLALKAQRLVSGNPSVDPRLVSLQARGDLVLAGARLTSENLALDAPGLAARLVLRGDLATGAYGLAGAAAARGWLLPDLGLANADAKLVLSLGGARPWNLRMNFAGRMARVDNATLTSLAGANLRFSGGLSLAGGQPLVIERARLDGTLLSLAATGKRLADGRASLIGSGRHAGYGPFRFDASLADDGPRATLVLADPWPAGGLRDVRLALAPIRDGFRVETTGGSMLGPFDGVLGIFMPAAGQTRVAIERFDVDGTAVAGSLQLGKGAATGELQLSGGGLTGSVWLSPQGGGQGIRLALEAANARFAGTKPIVIGNGRLDATGIIAHNRTTLSASGFGQGISVGTAFIGRASGTAELTNGTGKVTAALSGRRGSRFDLRLSADVAPDRIAALAQGEYAGRRIAMPRRAVFTREDGGWRMAPAQISFGGGRAVASGHYGGRTGELELALTALPLSLLDILQKDLGLGGTASGLISMRLPADGQPTGTARLQVNGLSRSGLLLMSRPVDLSLVADLGAGALQTRAVLRDGAQTTGRLQARIDGLGGPGDLAEQLQRGALFAQLRYNGAADALWRLVALEEFDLTGPVAIAADVRGNIAAPRIVGTVSSQALRLRSALIGADISDIAVQGRFSGSRLQLSSFAGRTANGGRVAGSGSFDLAGIGSRGPGIDLRIAATDARVLDRTDMAATVTGPVRIVSDGLTGTIAGRLALKSARWRLGRASAVEELPEVRTREINRRADYAPPRVASTAWRYLIDTAGDDRITVQGLGLDSEWSANVRLRGTTRAPTIIGTANLVRGDYEFAGKQFDLTRGRIAFAGESPPDPRLDIAAEATESGVTARVLVTGTALRPEIRFTSTPALPEEELLSRLLFGTSITEVSAPEALQLGAALAALRGGGGLDPVNKLRKAVGLDRLRIVGADAAIGRGTGVAVGKYLGRRFYAEVITDGRGYSATQLEFRITSWLSLLASVSSIGRESVNLKASKDY